MGLWLQEGGGGAVRELGQNGAGAGGSRPRSSRKGPRVSEHWEVWWPPRPETLVLRLGDLYPQEPQLQAGAQEDKRKTRRTPRPCPSYGL